MLDNAIIDTHFRKWNSAMTPSGPTDMIAAERAITQLYSQLGEEAPSIVWCQSLYQFVTLPSLLLGILHSDMWHAISSTMLSRPMSDDEWEKRWEEAWQIIWFEAAAPLVAGMTRTSRIAEQYPNLQEPLITHAKREIGLRLRSGLMRKFESRLRREKIHRTYWATQAWVPALAREHASRFTRELGREIEFHRNDYNVDWQYFLEKEAELTTLSRSIWQSFDALVTRMGAEPAAQMRSVVWIPFMMPFLATCSFWRDWLDFDFAKENESLDVWLNLTEAVSGIICVENIAFALEKPLAFHVNDRGNFHSETGPALTFSDGFALHAWHGVIVNKELIEAPETITLDAIDNCNNAEVRRVMIERFGQARYLQESGAVKMQEDDYGILYRKELPGDEPLVMVKVVNSTAEPDGTFKDYFLRVPPTMRTAREAVAWTFGFDGEETYHPQIET